MQLKTATALVTGGASGIGAATVRRLAEEGARVIVADVNLDGAREVAAEIDGVAVPIDVTDPASVRTAIAAGEQDRGPIDVLVNNAGGGDRFAFFVDTDPTVWDDVLRLNLIGVLACTHAVLPGMHRRRSGVIVNVASEAGRMGAVAGAVYSASKAGVIGFTRAIAREAASVGVRCNAVAPGPIETPLLNGASAASGQMGLRLKQAMIAATAMGRTGTPEEVASAIVFLASDAASFITGHTLAVSGGLVMI